MNTDKETVGTIAEHKIESSSSWIQMNMKTGTFYEQQKGHCKGKKRKNDTP